MTDLWRSTHAAASFSKGGCQGAGLDFDGSPRWTNVGTALQAIEESGEGPSAPPQIRQPRAKAFTDAVPRPFRQKGGTLGCISPHPSDLLASAATPRHPAQAGVRQKGLDNMKQISTGAGLVALSVGMVATALITTQDMGARAHASSSPLTSAPSCVNAFFETEVHWGQNFRVPYTVWSDGTVMGFRPYSKNPETGVVDFKFWRARVSYSDARAQWDGYILNP